MKLNDWPTLDDAPIYFTTEGRGEGDETFRGRIRAALELLARPRGSLGAIRSAIQTIFGVRHVAIDEHRDRGVAWVRAHVRVDRKVRSTRRDAQRFDEILENVTRNALPVGVGYVIDMYDDATGVFLARLDDGR